MFASLLEQRNDIWVDNAVRCVRHSQLFEGFVFGKSLLQILFRFVVHTVWVLQSKREKSNVSVERKCRGDSRVVWSLKNAEKIKKLFGWNRRGKDQSRKRLWSIEVSYREPDQQRE